MEELEESRKAAKNKKPLEDPERVRTRESLKLARTELQRQLALTENPARKTQITQAVAEIESRLKALS
jgi:hypothetical protein